MASLPSILILGADTVAAASPATAIQLVHACRLWGFSAVVPASWGDELIASDVIRRCAGRANRPVIQCSCPRVSERLAAHAAVLDDAVFWLVSPPVAVARYLRAVDAERDIHVTYAGACPGAVDPSIDESISPYELLAAISARGIDVAAQPTVFDDVIPADRRRHASVAGGLPDQHRLWDVASFRLSRPSDADMTVSVAQLLLAEERLLIDLSPTVGCVCRAAEDRAVGDSTSLQRSPSPIVTVGKIDLSRGAPSVPIVAPPDVRAVAPTPPPTRVNDGAPPSPPARPSQSRGVYRRSTWRRQSPRPGIIVARSSTAVLAINDKLPLIRRPAARLVVTAVLVTAALIIAFWIGRRTSPPASGSVGAAKATLPVSTAQLGHSRSR